MKSNENVNLDFQNKSKDGHKRSGRSLDVFAEQKRGMTNSKGRSMVEMLGVLAIIGVLSAGALKGYSAAMFRHKTNQTIDIFQGVLQRFIELDQKDFGNGFVIGEDGNGTATDIVTYGLLPDCQATSDGGCKLPLGTLSMNFIDSGSYLGDTSSYLLGEFWINFTDSKSCVAFASADWVNAVPVEWWRPDGCIRVDVSKIYSPVGSCAISGPAVTTVEMSNIIAGCQQCNEEGGCNWVLQIRGAI